MSPKSSSYCWIRQTSRTQNLFLHVGQGHFWASQFSGFDWSCLEANLKQLMMKFVHLTWIAAPLTTWPCSQHTTSACSSRRRRQSQLSPGSDWTRTVVAGSRWPSLPCILYRTPVRLSRGSPGSRVGSRLDWGVCKIVKNLPFQFLPWKRPQTAP